MPHKRTKASTVAAEFGPSSLNASTSQSRPILRQRNESFIAQMQKHISTERLLEVDDDFDGDECSCCHLHFGRQVTATCSPDHHHGCNPKSRCTEERMRHRLTEFFMTPWQKWRSKRAFPFRIVVQVIKIIAVTFQLLLFGSMNSARVNYGEQAELAFRHLFLLEWDPSYETLPYPPSTGLYALYTRDKLFESIGFALSNFNQTEEISISGYKFTDPTRAVTICVEHFRLSDSLLKYIVSTESVDCWTISVMELDPEKLTTPANVKALLSERGISINFTRFRSLRLHFQLDSPSVHYSDWDQSVDCFRFNISIFFENSAQSGQVQGLLVSTFINRFCKIDNKESRSSEVLSPSLRRKLHLAVDLLSFDLALLSTIFCVISIHTGLSLWKKTKKFFDQWYGIRLHGMLTEFVSPWYGLILCGDALIMSGSVFKLVSDYNVLYSYNLWSYLLGLGTLLVWLGILRYVGFSYHNSILLRTITRSVPSLLRFCVCACFIYFAFVFCAWVIIGPYHLKFRTLIATFECLFSLINGDDMYATFSIIGSDKGMGIFIFSRLFLYIFITLFIYVVLNIFVTIIFEAYEEVKELQDLGDRPSTNPLWFFLNNTSSEIGQQNASETEGSEEVGFANLSSSASWRRVPSCGTPPISHPIVGHDCGFRAPRKSPFGVDRQNSSPFQRNSAANASHCFQIPVLRGSTFSCRSRSRLSL